MYACGQCRELISDGSVSEGGDGRQKAVRPLLATKCGHLFHSDCLKGVFENKTGGGVWTKNDCPTCKTSLTVATDLLRIFPATFSVPGPSKKELQDKIKKYEGDLLELRMRLEASFLNLRDFENANKYLEMEVAKLNGMMKSQMVFLKRESDKRVHSLVLENEALSNALQKIHHNIVQVGNGGLTKVPPGFDHFDSMQSHKVTVFNGSVLQKTPSSKMNSDFNDNLSSAFENNLNLAESSQSHKQGTSDKIDPAVDAFLNELDMESAAGIVATSSSSKISQYRRNAKDKINGREPMYGRYFCDQCKATWGSAKNIIPQTCLKCGNVVFPHTLVPVVPKTSTLK